MIKQSSFSQKWINTVSEKYQYHDRNLIEKVIRAYSLLEMLVKNGCPAIWKGGSSLMLILGDSASRRSYNKGGGQFVPTLWQVPDRGKKIVSFRKKRNNMGSLRQADCIFLTL